MTLSFSFLTFPVVSDIIIDNSNRHHPFFDPNFVRTHHLLFEWTAFLIFLTICAAACFGLYKLFERQPKNTNTAPKPKEPANK
jgi:hypothetical protein